MKTLVLAFTLAALAACSSPTPPASSPTTDTASSANTLPVDSKVLAETLAKAGRPDMDGGAVDSTTFPFPVQAGKKSPDGYPIYLIECSDLTKVCVGPTGEPLGAIEVVAKELTPVRNADVLNPQYHCALICTDNQGNVVGAVSSDMLQYLATQKASATNVVPAKP